MSDINFENIEEVLDENVRPALALHGGNIVVTDFSNDILKVRLTGECASCASANSTVDDLVKIEIKKAFPSIKDVELVSGVSDALINEAKDILKKRHKK